MSQFLLLALLISNLLLCPFRCVSAPDAPAFETQAVAACACCHQECDSEPKQGGDFPSEDCTCPDCICHGATIQGSPDICLATSQVLSRGVTPLRIESSHIEFSKCLSTIAMSPPDHCGGRDALITFQTWLI